MLASTSDITMAVLRQKEKIVKFEVVLSDAVIWKELQAENGGGPWRGRESVSTAAVQQMGLNNDEMAIKMHSPLCRPEGGTILRHPWF